MTFLARVDPLRPDESKIREAARILRGGGTVIFPTETVYGLGANAISDQACASIFTAKGRPQDNPLIVHFASIGQVKEYAELPEDLESKAKSLWPGPVSFVLRSSDKISLNARAHLDTVAVRIPAHPVALMLIRLSGVPVAAPSANLSGRPSIVSGKAAIEDFEGRVDAIIDAGNTFFGIESTVLSRSGDHYTLLRPGSLDPEQLSSRLGRIEIPETAKGLAETDRPLTPGMKYLHYSPRKPLFRIENRSRFIEHARTLPLEDAMVICSDEVGGDIGREYHSLGSESNPYEIARNLFPSFRALDQGGNTSGWIHSFREEGIGLAIMNRIRKASRPA